ncbi:MAG: DUF2459 domain-containing protein [Beijerinckiaceae bacterium]
MLFLAAAVLRQPGDPTLLPKTGEEEVIFVLDHGYHASVVLPRGTIVERAQVLGLASIEAALEPFGRFAWVEIGWGDEGFYRHVPSVSFSTLPHILRALFRSGNSSVLHVVGFDGIPTEVFSGSGKLRLEISREGLDRMVRALDRSLLVEGKGLPVPLGPGLYGPSAFYAAREAYHVLNVCNHWLGRLLAEAGLPYAPVEATLSGGLIYDLRRRSAVKLPSRGL